MEDIISELSGIDSRKRLSAKYAAREVLHEGQPLFDMLLQRGLAMDGMLAERCLETCVRAADEKPEFAAKRAGTITGALLSGPRGNYRYFLSDLLLKLRPGKKESATIARKLAVWLCEESGKGPRACYLEAVVHLAEHNGELRPTAQKLIEQALKSPVPSFSARARVILQRAGAQERKETRNRRQK